MFIYLKFLHIVVSNFIISRRWFNKEDKVHEKNIIL